MADRTVSVRLQAVVTDYMAKMSAAGKATTDLADRVDHAQGKTKEGFHAIGTAMAGAGLLVAGGMVLAVRDMASFESKMALVKTLSRATSGEMRDLHDAALTMGQGIGFSANQVADAETELVKAGVSVKDMLGGALKGALDLAAAGQTDVAEATETAAIAMTQFSLHGKDVPHIADLIAAGADRALGSVQDLSYGLRAGGTEAAQLGLSIENTVGTLAEFAQSGLIGQRGGTVLKQMLISLVNPSHQAQIQMQSLGISAYDASGNFVSMSNLAGQLHDKLGPLTAAQRNQTLATLFGAHAIQGANILMRDGAAGNELWTQKVNAAGFAALQAGGKMDSLSGDVSKFKAAFNAAMIGTGETADGPLRHLVQDATDVINVWTGLPGVVQHGVIALTAIGGAATLAGGALILGIPKFKALDTALKDMSGGAVTARGSLSVLGKVGLGAAAILGLYEASKALGDSLMHNTTPSVNEFTSALIDLNKQTGPASTGLLDFLKASASIHDIGFLADATKNLDASLAGLVQGGHASTASDDFIRISQTLRDAGVSTAEITKLFPQYSVALSDSATSAKVAGNGIDQYGNAVSKAAQATQAATVAASKYNTELHAMADPVFALQQALSDLADKQTAATKATSKYGAGSKEAKAANNDLAQSALGVTDAADTLNGALKDGTTSTSQMRAQLKEWVRQGLLTQSQANNVAKSLDGVIGKAKTLNGVDPQVKITVNAAQAAAEINAVERMLAAINRSITISFHSLFNGSATKHAAGGPIGGHGGPTSDDQLILASTGEYVVNARSFSKHRNLVEAINADKFAAGGEVHGHKVRQGNVGKILGRLGDVGPGAGAGRIEKAIAAVALLSDAWQQTIQSMQDAAQKAGLVKALNKAQADLAKAEKETGKSAAADVANARQSLKDARAGLADFNEQQKQAKISRQIDRKTAKLQARETIAANKESYKFDRMSAKQQIADLTNRMAHEKKYSDQWMADEQQRKSLIQTERADAAQAAAAAAQQIAQQAASISQFADPTQQVGITQAPSITSLLATTSAQNDLLTQWMSQLALVRDKGLSEAAITLLGLDSGPQELGELLQINQGSASQIAQLNANAAMRASLSKSAASGVAAAVFDQGGRWPSGTLGVNLSGHDEWVSTSMPKLMPAASGSDFEIRVFIGDKELTDIVDTRISRRKTSDGHQSRRVLTS